MNQSLINKAHVRKYALDTLATRRPALRNKLTRVSEEFFTRIDAHLREYVSQQINSLPSVGKTIK
jgi:hypothetical protein